MTIAHSTPARTVRIGLIGAGGIAGAHVAGYLRNPDTVTFAAVAFSIIAQGLTMTPLLRRVGELPNAQAAAE